MNIVFATDTYWPRVNGVTVSISTSKRSLEKLGHSVSVITNLYPDEDEDYGKGVDSRPDEPNVYRFPSIGVFVSKEDRQISPFVYDKIFSTLDTLKPDVIHVHTEFAIGVLAKLYSRLHRVPLVMTCHTYYEQYINYYIPFLPKKILKRFACNFTRQYFADADVLIVPADRIRQVLVSYGLTDASYRLIPTGLVREDFALKSGEARGFRDDFLADHPAAVGKRILLFVGRVGHEKNIDLLLKVIEILRTTEKDILLVVTGDGPYREELEKKIEKQNLGSLVEFTGYVDRRKLKYLYSMASVFVFPSVTETQGLVTIEAMICGTPVVAVGEMGTKDVMAGDNGGFMVSNDAAEFAARVRELLSDEKLYAMKKEEAAAYAGNWTIDRMSTKLLDAYRDAVTIRASGTRTLRARISRYFRRKRVR
jgi:1,2-diacylglycerol 3-alpha-glucosyltransferase